MDASSPVIENGRKAESIADFQLFETEQRSGDMTRPERRSRELVPVAYLELEAGVQLAEIVQKRQNSQSGCGRNREAVSTGRLLESRPQYRIEKQYLKARRNISAMMFETMEVVRCLEFSPCAHG